MIDLSPMDYVRAALANGQIMGMDIADMAECARHAATPEAFDRAVNELAQMTQTDERAMK